MNTLDRLGTALSGQYEVVRELGRGGMATVYLARDLKHDRHVALKVVNPELGAVLGVERFLAEIKVTANLQHPNLLPLFDSGDANGMLYYVMPYVEGESLRARLEREKQLPVEEAIRIAVAVADALDYAHGHAVIHRDLKPENILLQHGQPLVADFGIALAVSRAGGNRITQTGLSLGTPAYMSPEQATGDRTIDGRTDVYSLAAVLYEMLTGEPPHIGSTAQAVIARMLTDKPRPLRSVRATVPAHVEATVERALAKLPADRFATAGEFAEALQGVRGVVPFAATPPPREHRVVSALRSPAWALACVAVTGVAVWSLSRDGEVAGTRPIRYSLVSSAEEGTPTGNFAFSSDGSTVVYSAVGVDTVRRLYRRELSEPSSVAITGTEGARAPFVSPDGKWVAFFTAGALKKARLDGGSVATIAAVITTTQAGGVWLRSGAIVFTNAGRLAVVPSAGGMPTAIIKGDSAIQASQLSHRSPGRQYGSVHALAGPSGEPADRRGVTT